MATVARSEGEGRRGGEKGRTTQEKREERKKNKKDWFVQETRKSLISPDAAK